VTFAGKTHRFTRGISDRLPEIDHLDWQLQAEA
jgi:hypothetical protein